VPALRKALQNEDINIREQSVTALGKILQGEEVLIMLKTAMDDTAPLVRFAALQVLIEIKNKMESKSILILLNKALKDPEQIIRQRANNTIREILSNTSSHN
jgi:HEAT repeat protein